METSESGSPPVLAPPRQTMSLWPAALVGVLGVVLIVGFTALSALGPSKVAAPPGSAARFHVAGTGLTSRPAAGALRPILTPGSPPANIVASVTIPTTARAVRFQTTSATSGQYDATAYFVVHRASQADIITFYRSEIRRLGWKTLTVGPVPNGSGIQIAAQKAGGDGRYWEQGVIVSPTTFAGGPIGGASGASSASSASSAAAAAENDDTTAFSVELFQVASGE